MVKIRRKKSQMEILGLAFLFVIIIFGFLFFMKLSSESSTKDTTEEYVQPKMASAFTDMFLHTTVKCGDGYRLMKDLFINCISYPDSANRDSCDVDDYLFSDPYNYYIEFATYDHNMDSCEIVKSYLELAANLTLKNWSRPYYVEAYKIQDIDNEQINIFPTFLGESINYSIPELGIDQCYYDPNGYVRSYRSRWQPLPLVTGGQVVLQTGLCY